MTDILWVPIVGLALAILLFVVFFLAMSVVAILDIYDEHKNRVWNELQRTNYERRRPAAK
jgi:F0F1-type ATP synthase membrane subunit b/b'